MKEQLISFETAKLAKEKGFNVYCEKYINNDNEINYVHYGFPCPSQSLLQKWIRDVHNIHVMVDCNASGWYWELFKTNGTGITSFNDCGYNPAGQWDFYEEALEAGLLVALNHIIIDTLKHKCQLCDDTGRCEPRTLSDPDGQECDCCK